MQRLVKNLYKYRYILLASLAVLLLVVGVLVYKMRFSASSGESMRVSDEANKGKLSTKEQPSISEAKDSTASQESQSETKPADAATNTPEKSAGHAKSGKPTVSTSSPQTPVVAQPPSPSFSVGPMGGAYTSCVGGVLYYTVYSTWIGSGVPTTQSFTWKLEASDGTVSDSGTDTMPAGSSIWHNFPSTPSYPSTLGAVIGASDGDKVRIIITSPNYAASTWSEPVPTGSEDACRNGSM